MVDHEAFGVDYERYALGRLFSRLVKKYDITNVLEIPASGAKAAPSIYSLGFGLAGCNVTLINPVPAAMSVWKKLGLMENVRFIEVVNIENTSFADNSFDLVWNFATFPTAENPQGLLREMARVSKKYVAALSVNRFNVGFPIHRAVHTYTKIPWSHGDIRFNSPPKVKQFFTANNLSVVETGLIDCPPWPDSLGFRDVRLHRMNTDLTKIDWHSDIVDYILTNRYPKWIKLVYFFERIPMPKIIKLLYSHLFYVIGMKKNSGEDALT